MVGIVQNQDFYMQFVVVQCFFFFDYIKQFIEQAMDECYQFIGCCYECVMIYKVEDVDYFIFGQGSVVLSVEVVVDYLCEICGLKVGVVDFVMFCFFLVDLLGKILKGKKGVVIFECFDQLLAVDLLFMWEVCVSLIKCLENGNYKDNCFYLELEVY